MKTTVETIINFRNCPYSFGKENLANMRRSQLQRIGAAVGIVGDRSKNELLTILIARLDAMGAEKELTDISALK